ncbi:protein of unknown function (DUF4780) [Popillia japonica]|uniref:DUF4780 domain-containing protein n=1 Tax=Popillia japonica TaxID=7064 RepID=A0AAW1IDE3_POPJA
MEHHPNAASQLPNQGFAPEEARKKAEEHKTGEQRTLPATPKRKRKETIQTHWETRRVSSEPCPQRQNGRGRRPFKPIGKYTTSTFTGQTPEKLLALIEAQNEGLTTNVWNVLSLKDEGKGKLLRVGIDDTTYQTIKSKGYTIYYRFGSIPVHALRKQQKENRKDPTPSTSKEGKPGSDVGSTSHLCISDLYRGEPASETMKVEELGKTVKKVTPLSQMREKRTKLLSVR